MNLSPYLANKLARWMAGQAMPTAPTSLFVGLWNGDPLAGGTEVGATITGAAARIAVAIVVPANDGIDNLVEQSAETSFGLSVSVTPVNVTYTTLHDAVTAGNILAVRELDTPKTIAQNDTVKFPLGDLSFSFEKHTP